jgi:hypothetical protein
MIQEYQPSPFGKLWGNDPDYMKMLKDISAIAERSNVNAGARGDIAVAASGNRMRKGRSAS